MHIATITNMTKRGTSQEILDQLTELEEDKIMVGFHHEIQKAKDKSWHDRHMKEKKFKEGDIVLLYESKYLHHPEKIRMHWLRPYEINSFIDGGVVKIYDLTRNEIQGLVNGSQMKLYRDSQPSNPQ
jgi:hypothetical protein